MLQVKRADQQWVKHFPDGDEGPWASHRRTKSYLKWLLPRITPWNKLHRRSSLSRTGIVGVTISNDRTRAGNRVRRWVAYWPTVDGGHGKRTFSVPKYGERRARALAIEARKQGVDELLTARAIR